MIFFIEHAIGVRDSWAKDSTVLVVTEAYSESALGCLFERLFVVFGRK
jgi:hypothetical protein